ncbi:MAG: NUDIX domain-containing protein [Candidatus Nanopelagicales bacterium]
MTPWRPHADAVRVLASWPAPDPEQALLRLQFLEYLARRADGVERSASEGHLTASCLVVDHTGMRCLLTLHGAVGRWLQTGGHIESIDDTLRAAAAREAIEETGIPDLVLTAEPVQLDRHPVRCGGRELDHLDVQYAAVASAVARVIVSAESDALAWFDFDDLPPDADTAVRSLVARVRALGLVDCSGFGGRGVGDVLG